MQRRMGCSIELDVPCIDALHRRSRLESSSGRSRDYVRDPTASTDSQRSANEKKFGGSETNASGWMTVLAVVKVLNSLQQNAESLSFQASPGSS